jgi:hypothetical protein
MSIDITKLREGDIITLDCLSDDSTDSVYEGDAEFICTLDDGEVMVRIPGYSHPWSFPATTIVAVKYTRPVVDITNLKKGDVVIIKFDGYPEQDYIAYKGKAVFLKEVTLGDALFDVEGSEFPCIFPLNSITEILPKHASENTPEINTNEEGYTSEYLLANKDKVILAWDEPWDGQLEDGTIRNADVQARATVADCIKLQRFNTVDWSNPDIGTDEACLARFITTHLAYVIWVKNGNNVVTHGGVQPVLL